MTVKTTLYHFFEVEFIKINLKVQDHVFYASDLNGLIIRDQPEQSLLKEIELTIKY